ncbi:helix-turn-helix transcriptional regulator [Patulibacter defluvii]|uniref:helix-turn-helix transcriptional regulator n=1 Tax=Patulibacter defluvii TaxID=3095358 RepID=UPI002A748A20|nr:LuxR C-terminal-related transcriptional regulator [Patulibacter sp. DM4]
MPPSRPPADAAAPLEHLRRLRRMPAVHRRLRDAPDVAALLAAGAQAAREECGFDRALVLTLDGDRLRAGGGAVLSDPASDELRRRALAAPVRLEPGSPEAELIRRPDADVATDGRPSPLAAALGLRSFALGAIQPEARVLALLVVDRAEPAVGPLDRAQVGAFAAMLAVALERVVLRARIGELSRELRHLTSSTQALIGEVNDAPIAIPTGRGHGSAFPRFDVLEPVATADGPLSLLSPREIQVASLLVEGRSNREIAGQLMLSPETVKDHVARLLRKLGAGNRVEAVARYLALVGEDAAARGR